MSGQEQGSALRFDKLKADLRLKRLETLGRLVESAAHDYGNLLTVLQGYSDVVLNHPGLPPELAASVRKLATAAERVGGINRQLMAFSRLDFSGPRPTDVNDAIRRWSPLIRRLLKGGVGIGYQLDASLPMACLDPAFLDQMIVVGVALVSEVTSEGQIVRITTVVESGNPKQHPSVDVVKLSVEVLHSNVESGWSEAACGDRPRAGWLPSSDCDFLETACAAAQVRMEIIQRRESFGLAWLLPMARSKEGLRSTESSAPLCAAGHDPALSTPSSQTS